MKRSVSLALAALLFTGCSLAPKLEVTPPELPAASGTTVTVSDRWWEAFGDPKLNALIEEALTHNDDLKLAITNVTLARAALGLDRAAKKPEFTGGAGASRQQESGKTFGADGNDLYNRLDLSATVRYELDFWGALENREKAALAQLAATEADRATVGITLAASTARLYVTLAALDQQIALTRETVQAHKETYDYRQRQFTHQVIDELALEQARVLYANARLTLAELEETRLTGESALSILLGRSPGSLFREGVKTDAALPEPVTVPAALPSDLLERRPDILAAEARLKSANALIGAAKAAYFPTLSLTGSAGVRSQELGTLLTEPASFWNLGASLTAPLLDMGRVESGVQIAQAQKEAARVEYGKTVKNAFREAYDALGLLELAGQKVEAQKEGLEAQETIYRLSEKRFDTGYGNYLELLDAQRERLKARNNMIALEAGLLKEQITLFQVLGGGWRR